MPALTCTPLRPVAPHAPEEVRLRTEAAICKLNAARMRPTTRDWSNVVFSVAFCEEARRDWELRNAG